MKNYYRILSAILLIFIVVSCKTLSISHRLLSIEKGMTKAEVSSLLGTPDYRRFTQEIEQWEFIIGETSMRYGDVIIVDFVDGKVVHLNSFKSNLRDINDPDISVNNGSITRRPSQRYEQSTTQYTRRPSENRNNKTLMSKNEFGLFYNKVKKTPFADDKLHLITLESTRSSFTCQQCKELMSIYSFDDDKLKILQIIASNIIDIQNHQIILDSFSFLSTKDKAKDILLLSK